MNTLSPVMALSLIGLLSLLCQWLAFRLKIPAILPLLLTGLLLGPTTAFLDPDALLGELLFPIVSLSVAVILFEGSLTLNFRDLKGRGKMVRNLVGPGMLITFALAAVSAWFILSLPPGIAALLGALVVVTGPTVIAPLLRTIRARENVATVLHWEGVLIDPIGALLVVLVFEYLIVSQTQAIQVFALTVLTGLTIGVLAGWLMAKALRKRVFPRYLESIATLLLMLTAFALSNELTHESGLLTVTIMGIWMANSRGLDLEPIMEFKETLTILLLSGLFILLAARIRPEELAQLNWHTGLWIAFLILVARPVAVWISAIGTPFNAKERLLIGWIAPRGIVAAAVSALFALKLEQQGVTVAAPLVALVFVVIVTTVILQSVLTRPLVKLMGLQAPERTGYLIFGANPFAVAVAEALQKMKVPVLLSDTNWDYLSQARMKNLPVYYGNPVSEHADSAMDLSQLRRVLILSPYRQLNTEVAYHYQDRFGADKVYRLAEQQKEQSQRRQVRDRHQKLFGESAQYGTLINRIKQGAQIRQTRLSDSYGWAEYCQDNPDSLPLFARTQKGKLRTFTADAPFEPQADWEVLALHPKGSKAESNSERES
ncbi:sodium:proton antiporter [Ferrimonas gelatinilytica]|uniref:Sodium:proton antiporter n=1 Tax=Ferrimonas gelatinilytica TaxID=1255257 RepID=A0ABP9RV62_9GAMM